MPLAIASRFDAKRGRFAVEADLARVGRVHAEQRQREFGAAGAEQAGEPEDLARADLKLTSSVVARRASGSRPRQDLRSRQVGSRVVVVEVLARHQDGELTVVHVAWRRKCRVSRRRAAR